MKIKTGTITFHCSLNFGSVLQTYALQKVQQRLGIDNEIINYIYDHDVRRYKLFRTHLYKSNPMYIAADLLTLSNTVPRRQAYDQFNKKFIKTSQEEFHDSAEIKLILDRYDAVICGSDQIWNTSATKKVVPAFFLDFAWESEITKIAYAPSLGRSEIEDCYKADFKNSLENLDFISVREKSSTEVIKQLSGEDVVQVLDPVLLLKPEDYDEILSPVKVEKPYIFYYALEKNKTIASYVSKLAEELGCSVVYFSKWITSPFKNGKNIYSCGPGEFLYLLKNADFVVTNSFHGTAFSVLFQKQFATFTTQHSYPRMVDFLKTVFLEDRIQKGQLDIKSAIDYKHSNRQLFSERERSLDYLVKSLENTKSRKCEEPLCVD